MILPLNLVICARDSYIFS